MHNSFLLQVVGDPPIVMLQPVYMVLVPSTINPEMEKLGVSVALSDVGNASTLLLSRPL